MTTTIRRQLSEEEKQVVLERHGRICYATGHPIEEGERLHFDHIKALYRGGSTDVNNIAPMCEKHNKEKGTLSLYDFRTKLRIGKFFSQGDALTLQHELAFLKKEGSIKKYGETVPIIDKNTDSITVEIDSQQRTYLLHRCGITGWEYFYALLPVDVINSDDDTEHEDGLQPRYLIRDKVFNLFRHFQENPVLQPSLCRMRDNKVLTFDGQHKIAAMLWNGHTQFESKVYVAPDIRRLNEANISAHDKYAQTRFYSSIMVAKLGHLFGKDFESYKNEEDSSPKSEKGFFDYLQRKNGYSDGDVKELFRSWLYGQVGDDPNNKLSQFISKSGNRRTAATPITMDMLKKSIFRFMYRSPVSDSIATDTYLRDVEVGNMVRFCNILVDEGLGKWSADDHAHPKQLNLRRVFSSKSMMAWSELLKGAICGKLDIEDEDEREMPFYQRIDDNGFDQMRKIVRRLFDWNKWDSPANSDIDGAIADNKSRLKQFLRKGGLTTSYLMGVPE